MGGEAFLFKHRMNQLTNTSKALLFHPKMAPDERDGSQWRYMKMACGENAINVFSKYHKMPSSRMGESWMFRKKFEQARKLLQQQKDWCASSTPESLLSTYPFDLSLESTIAVLKGQVKLVKLKLM